MASAITTILTGLYGFYNMVFQPVLSLGPFISLGIFSAGLAGIFSVIYWLLLDIDKADELKEKISQKQDKMKEARKDDETDEASNYMQETMQLNQKLMMLNFKPMIATMFFVALIFPWLGSTFAPSVELNETAENVFTGELEFAGNSESLEVVNKSNTTVELGDQKARVGDSIKAHGIRWDIKNLKDKNGGFLSTTEGKVLKVNAHFVDLPFSIPFAGDELNWLGFYIVLAMPLTFIFRKMLGVN